MDPFEYPFRNAPEVPELSQTGQPVPLLLGMGSFWDEPGGLNRYLRDLLSALSARAVAARAVVVGPGADSSLGEIPASSRHDALLRRLWRFARVARRAGAGASVIDAHFALYAFAPVVLGRLRHLPLVVHFQGPWAQESAAADKRIWELAAKRWVERAVYRRASEVVVLSAAFKRILLERYHLSPWHIHVIPPGVDLQHFVPGCMGASRAELAVADDERICLAVRRLVPRMGLDVLLEAWSLLAAGRQDLILLIAGEGPDRAALEVRAGELGIASRVRFLGKVSEQDLVACYRAADVCVVPSVALEGFGLVVLEALACGTPVVATDVGGLPEALSRLDASLVVPGGDPFVLAARLRGWLDGHAPLPSAERCRAYAEGFSWDLAAVRNLDVYRQAIEPPARDRLRVVYLDHYAGLSGGELALARLLPALEGVDPHVILAQDGPLVSRLAGTGVSVEVLPMAEGARGLRRDRVRPGGLPWRSVLDSAVHVGRLAGRLRRLRPDIVHTNSLKSALYGGIAARLAGVPVVWHIRDRITAEYLPRPAVLLIRALTRHVPGAVIANSQSTLAALPRLKGREFVIHSPIGITNCQRRPGPADTALRVGMIGRIAPWKGQHVFLEAFARAFPDGGGPGARATAVIVGVPLFGEEPYERELQEVASRLGLSGRLEWPGFVEDVGGCLAGFDILVHASVIPEPFGQVVVEGMAAGLPVVASRAGGPEEIIDDRINGMLTPPGDVVALAEALEELAGDPALRRRLGDAAKGRASEFTPQLLAPKVMGVYRELLGKGARG